jgi:beta-lactamase regulating signal transducer with metallopeptidase domain
VVTVVDAMLGNAAVAAGLALLAVAAGYLFRSPAVRHALWVVVLLKLVTPPLFPIPLTVLPASWAPPQAAGNPNFEIRALTQTESNPATGSGTGGQPASAAGSGLRLADMVTAALVVWAAGALGWFAWQGRRIVGFRRRVRRAEDASPDIAAAAARLAAALGIDHPPAVKVAAGIGSPMLWGWGRGTVVLLPRGLLDRLAPEARDTLLAHELAHFLRRDHWVRVLEFAATGLYWWHPAVWLARRGIEAAEEECCDAWVVGGLAASPRRYAEALLATVDYEAELRRPVLPPAVCTASRSARVLHRRLYGIINATRPRKLPGGRWTRAAIVVALLVQPVLRAATPDTATETPPDIAITTDRATRPVSVSRVKPPLPRPAEPRAWATASAPTGSLTVLARDREMVLRRADGTDVVLGPGRPLALSFAPDGRRLATAGPGPLVRAWDDRGTLLAAARCQAAARAVAFTPDGGRLLVLDADRRITVRDPQTLAVLAEWTVEGPANSLAVSPDGQTVAVAFGAWLAETGWVECWSIAGRKRGAVLHANAPVGAVRFTPDGRAIVIGGWNGLVAWRSLPGGDLIAERRLANDVVATAAFCPDAGTLPAEPPPEPPPQSPPFQPLMTDPTQEEPPER